MRGDAGGGVQLLLELGLTRPIGRFCRAARLSGFIDQLDSGLARLRKHLGRFVPDGPAPRRYP